MANAAWEAGKEKEALQLFKQAAKEGDIYAFNSIGYFFDLGIAVPKNKKKALLWYKKAAKTGDIEAYSNIGTVYRDLKNLERAKLWFQRALNAGDKNAALEIGKIYLIKKNITKARYYLNLAKNAEKIAEASLIEANQLLKSLPKSTTEARENKPQSPSLRPARKSRPQKKDMK